MNDEEEDGVNIEAAVRFRQLLKGQAQDTFDPLHQSMLEMDRLADEAGLMVDFDQDFSDIDTEY